MLYLIRLVIISALAWLPTELLAQSSACVNGQFVPYFGWDRTECTNCAIRGPYIEYLKEPWISGIRGDGPAAGRLREHDMLLAVDGLAITTPEAWHRLRDAKAGESVRFTVSNSGETREETIRASGRCIAGPPPAQRVIIIRRKPASM